MLRLFFAFLVTLAVASAFTSPQPRSSLSSVQKARPLFMFSADGDAKSKSLSEVTPGDSADALKDTMASSSSASPSEEDPFKRPPPKTMTVKNRNTGEFYEVEMNESFLANEKFEMNWWAWVFFVGFPFTVLANDVFHFLPQEGPLGFLGSI